MTDFRIIGLTGKAGVGKDTVANRLCAQHGFVRYALASPLKRGLAATFGLDVQDFEDRVIKEKVIPWIGKSPRQLAQTFGTEWGRNMVADDIWLRIAEQFVLGIYSKRADFRDSPNGVVITDVRFDNEAKFVKRMGGEVWRILRPASKLAHVNPHASESGISDGLYDRTIFNDSTVDYLNGVVDEIMEHAACTQH